MAKVMISRDALDDYTQLLSDVSFGVKLELNTRDNRLDRDRIVQLVQQLTDAWDSVYSPIDRDISYTLRKLYGAYVQCKKEGNMDRARFYLQCYLDLKRGGQ